MTNEELDALRTLEIQLEEWKLMAEALADKLESIPVSDEYPDVAEALAEFRRLKVRS